MTVEIHIYSDYVCPYCLLAERVIKQAASGPDVRIRWHPFELRPYPVPTLRVEDDYLPRVWRTSVYPMAERLGVRIVLPRISPQPRTRLAFELFAMAEEQDLGHPFSMRVFRAFFQEERNIGDTEVLVELAAEVGLDPAAAREALDTGKYEQTHRDALRHAIEDIGVSVVPTILIGNQRLEGVPDVRTLQNAIDLLGRH